MEGQTGVELTSKLLENLQGSQIDYVYIDEDEDGQYLGLVFTDGETEYHLTVQQDGFVQLASGPEEGDQLEEVLSFNLGTVEEPLSEEGPE